MMIISVVTVVTTEGWDKIGYLMMALFTLTCLNDPDFLGCLFLALIGAWIVWVGYLAFKHRE